MLKNKRHKDEVQMIKYRALTNRSFYIILLSMTLILSSFSTLILNTAEAAASRAAIVDRVIGEVYVKKAGGSKSFRVYTNMALNQGDYITTMANSGLVLSMADRDDQITLGEHVELFISELLEDEAGKKSKWKLWSGSLWAKVSSLFGTDDEFEIETPTAIMGVRGTTLLVGTDPMTGETRFFLASGEGHVSDRMGSSPVVTILNPYDILNIDDEVDPGEYEQYRHVAADMDQIVAMTSRSIIESFIASWEQVAAEHEQYITYLSDEANQETDEQERERYATEIERIQHNLDLMIGQLMHRTVEQGLVSQNEMIAFIQQVNASLLMRLYEDERALQLSEEELEKQALIDELLMLREERQRALDLQRQQQREQRQDIVDRLRQQHETREEVDRERREAERRSAEEQYREGLELGERVIFDQELRNIEEEERRQDAERQGDFTTPVTPPVTPPSGGSGGQQPGDGDGAPGDGDGGNGPGNGDDGEAPGDGGNGPGNGDGDGAPGDGDDGQPGETDLEPEPDLPVSTVTSEWVEHSYSPYMARLTLSIYDEQGEPITDLTAEDVAIENLLTDGVPLSLATLNSSEMMLQVIEDFIALEEPGHYSVVIAANHTEDLIQKTKVLVQDLLITEHLYIIFNRFDVPSQSESAIAVELCVLSRSPLCSDFITSVIVDVDVSNSYGHALDIMPEEVLLIRENGDVVSHFANYYDEAPEETLHFICMDMESEDHRCQRMIVFHEENFEDIPYTEWMEVVVRGVSMGEFFFTNQPPVPPYGMYTPQIGDEEDLFELMFMLLTEFTEQPLQAEDLSFYAEGQAVTAQFDIVDMIEMMADEGHEGGVIMPIDARVYFVAIVDADIEINFDTPYTIKVASDHIAMNLPFKLHEVIFSSDNEPKPNIHGTVIHDNPALLEISYYDYNREVPIYYDESRFSQGQYSFEVPFNELYNDAMFKLDGVFYLTEILFVD